MAGTTYTIYIVNQSATKQSFWCFQAPPQELANDPVAFANSGALLAVPLNEKAGLNAETVSDATDDASLRQPFEVSYLTMQLTEQSSPGSSPLTYYITTGREGSDAPASGDDRSSNLIAITIPARRPRGCHHESLLEPGDRRPRGWTHRSLGHVDRYNPSGCSLYLLCPGRYPVFDNKYPALRDII